MAAVEQNPYESDCALDEHLVMIIIETIRDDDSLRSKRFSGKFRCFGRRKRMLGERRVPFLLSPSFLFCPDDGNGNEDVRHLHILMGKNSDFCER